MNHSELISELIKVVRNNQATIEKIEIAAEGNKFILNLLKESFTTINEHVIVNLSNLITNFLFINKIDLSDLVNYLQKEFNDPYDQQTLIRENEDAFDSKFGTTTGMIKQQFELHETISIERFVNSAKYHPTPVKSMYLAMDSLELLNLDYSKSAFIDVGSGMGRCLLIASEYSFDKVIGVEISEYLHKIAESNINIYKDKKQKCTNIKSLCIDIIDFEIPDNESIVLYFWEPFPDTVFNKFFSKLLDVINLRGCKVSLIFLGRVFPTVENSEVFKRVKKLKTPDKARANKELEPQLQGEKEDLYYYYRTDNYYLTIYNNHLE